MAVLIDAGTDLLYINPATGGNDDQFVITGWYRHDAAPPSEGYVCWWSTTAGGGVRLSIDTAGDLNIVGSATAEVKAGLTAGRWYFVAMVRGSATATRAICYDPSDGSISTVDVSTSLFAHGVIALGGQGTAAIRGALSDFKVRVNVAGDLDALQAEALEERFTRRPWRRDGLWGWWPMFPGATERARDWSGNGRNLTQAGTLTDIDGPPLAWGGAVQIISATTTAPTIIDCSIESLLGTTVDSSSTPVIDSSGDAPTAVSSGADLSLLIDSSGDAPIAVSSGADLSLLIDASVEAQGGTTGSSGGSNLLDALAAAVLGTLVDATVEWIDTTDPTYQTTIAINQGIQTEALLANVINVTINAPAGVSVSGSATTLVSATVSAPTGLAAASNIDLVVSAALTATLGITAEATYNLIIDAVLAALSSVTNVTSMSVEGYEPHQKSIDVTVLVTQMLDTGIEVTRTISITLEV